MTSDRGGQAFRLGLFLLPSSALLSGICLFVACVSGSRGRDRPVWQARWTQPFLVTALLMLVVALRRGILQKAPMERAWWTATLVLVAMHATDLPLFDSRLKILGWTLLAGLAAFNQEREQTPSPRPDRDAPAASPEPGAP